MTDQKNIQQATFDFFTEMVTQENTEFESEEQALDMIIQSRQEEEQWEPEITEEDFPPASAVIREEDETASPAPVTLRTLKRIAAGFLASRNPDYIGSGIKGLLPHLTIDAGSVSLAPRTQEILKTTLVLATDDPAKCLMPRIRREKTEAALAEAMKTKEELEAKIRTAEPELNASLFAETAEWEYTKTKMKKYHFCLRKIEKLRYDLQFSGKMERIIAEQLANENYLILPDGTALPEAIPAEWGIITIKPDHTHTVVREAVYCSIPQEKAFLFALCTASGTLQDTLFANGIARKEKELLYSLPPKRRKTQFTVPR